MTTTMVAWGSPREGPHCKQVSLYILDYHNSDYLTSSPLVVSRSPSSMAAIVRDGIKVTAFWKHFIARL